MIYGVMKYAPSWVMPVVIETMDYDRTSEFSIGMKVYYGEHGFTTVNTEEQQPMGVVSRAPDDNYQYLCVQGWVDEDDNTTTVCDNCEHD